MILLGNSYKMAEIELGGLLLGSEILNPYAYRSYRSIIRKAENIKGHLIVVNDLYHKINNSLPIIEPDDENRIICSLQDCCENIYSCMDYVSQVLRQACKEKYKGVELPDGFNDILRDVEKYEKTPNEEKRPMYRNKILRSYILKAKHWYEVVHDIRTEETHYGMGELIIADGIVYYYNLRRSRRNISDKSNEIIFDILLINGIVSEFFNYINELDKLILKEAV